MNNPLRILKTVDARLDQPVEFFLFGRAALVLGFANFPPEAGATKDVDGIIPRDSLAGLRSNGPLWTAIRAANEELAAEGLYMTHLFDEEQIILRANWRTFPRSGNFSKPPSQSCSRWPSGKDEGGEPFPPSSFVLSA